MKKKVQVRTFEQFNKTRAQIISSLEGRNMSRADNKANILTNFHVIRRQIVSPQLYKASYYIIQTYVLTIFHVIRKQIVFY